MGKDICLAPPDHRRSWGVVLGSDNVYFVDGQFACDGLTDQIMIPCTHISADHQWCQVEQSYQLVRSHRYSGMMCVILLVSVAREICHS